jgi:hypothetical protein
LKLLLRHPRKTHPPLPRAVDVFSGPICCDLTAAVQVKLIPISRPERVNIMNLTMKTLYGRRVRSWLIGKPTLVKGKSNYA